MKQEKQGGERGKWAQVGAADQAACAGLGILLEAAEILLPPTYQLRRRQPPDRLLIMPTTSVRPPTTTKLYPPRTSATAISSFSAISSTSTSDNGSESDTAVSASGFVAATGWSHYLSNPSLRQCNSALGLGHQVNPVRGPATSSRFDDASSRLFIRHVA
ncbi:hypothetical protein M422DRAFT_242836 [Sphaerobolus stellatus SS14]|nr:hypothetical protein M422DRAFT_242836 [Sphaerobolus stellatus SS14]